MMYRPVFLPAMNRSQAEYWLKQARSKAKRCSSAVRSMIAQALRRFRMLVRALRSQLHPADRHLLTLDVSRPRNALRDVIRQQGDKLASAAAKYLTLNADYIARRSFAKARAAAIIQTHPWRGLLTHQSPCPAFESGDNTLPGMERFIEPQKEAA